MRSVRRCGAVGHQGAYPASQPYERRHVRQAEVPVLTIAMDAGFQSLNPFNRAFKAETGLTPTEYRRSRAGRVVS